MRNDIYKKLQKHLDRFGIGFPATASGIEIEILKRLFILEDAEMFLNMSETPEPPQMVAKRINKDSGVVAGILERMATDGLLFRFGEGEKACYSVAPFLIGIYENKIKVLDRELSKLIEEYFDEALTDQISQVLKDSSLMRVVPVGRSLRAVNTVSTYDQNREYIQSKEKIAISECICRIQKRNVGKGCDNPIETCMIFDWYADYFVKNSQGRFISQEEALEIQDRCEKAGLVSLTSNLTEGGIVLCHCCGCCCLGLGAAKSHPRPTEVFVSSYVSSVHTDLCTGCEACLDWCQMEAIRVEDDTASIDPDRCIGCGICVPVCPEGALELLQKPYVDQPMNPLQAAARLAEARKH